MAGFGRRALTGWLAMGGLAGLASTAFGQAIVTAPSLMPSPSRGGDVVAGGSLTLKLAESSSRHDAMPRGRISAKACDSCSQDALPSAPKPLIASLPAGESYEIRVLKSAVSGFSLRASDGGAPAFPEERWRIKLSRQHVMVSWEAKF